MSVRALALALAVLVPPAFGSAAPASLGPTGSGDALASAKRSTAGNETASEAAAKGGEAKAAAPKAKARAKGAPATTLSSLRRDCYGGKGKTLEPLVRDVRDNQLMEAVREQKPEPTVRAARILLQGGEENHALLEVYQQALSALEDAESKKAAKACVDLIHVIFPQDGP